MFRLNEVVLSAKFSVPPFNVSVVSVESSVTVQIAPVEEFSEAFNVMSV